MDTVLGPIYIYKYMYVSSDGMECLLLQASSQMRKQVLVGKAMYARHFQIKVLSTCTCTVKII